MLPRLLLALLLLTGCSELSAPEPAGPLTGDALVEALQAGGLVVYLRHAATDDAPDGLPTDPCSRQRGLTEAGRQQARDIGAAVRALDRAWMSGAYAIPVYNVREQWLARWNRIERPQSTSLVGMLPETWWARPSPDRK